MGCLGGNAGHIDDNDFAPVRICGARDGAVLLEVNGRPIKSIGRGDGPALRPGVGKVRREGDKVRGDKGAWDPGLSNSAPRYGVAVASGGGGGGEAGDEDWSEVSSNREK